MLTPLLLAALCLVPGLPLAVLLARSRPGRSPFPLVVVDGVLLGLAWYLLLAIVLAHRHALSRASVMVPTLVLAAAVVAFLVVGPARRWTGIVANPTGDVLANGVTVAFVVGALLRTKPAYFIYQIGDFGEYVNRGNVLADQGQFSAWFTHGFSVLLALSHTALGAAREVDVMGFLGLMVMATVLAVATRLGATAWARLVLAIVFAIGVVPVWFSNFPASETLYALLLVGMLLFLVAAVQTRHLPTAAVAGVLAFLLMLTRGNAVLAMPLLVAVAFVVAPFVQRVTMRVVVTFTAASLAGLYLGFVYNSRFSHPYFIAYQMPTFFPMAVWRKFEDLGGMRAATWKGVVFAVAVALLSGLAVAVNRWATRPSSERVTRVGRVVLLPLLLVLGLVALGTVLHAGGLRDGLDHYDGAIQVLLVLGIVGACVAFARRQEEHVLVGVLFAALFALAFALLHAFRFEAPRYAPYYLYWDRYLWSEFFPMMMLLATFGIALVQEGVRRLGRARLPVGVVLVAAVALGTVTMWSAGSLSRRHRFMGNAYGDLAEVDRLAGSLPIVYVGIPRTAVSPFMAHPNTFRMFGMPLTQTFGRQVLNIEIPAYGDDPQPTVQQSMALLQAAGYDEGAVVQVLLPGEALPPAVRPRGVVDVTIPMLDRPVWVEPTAWHFAHYRIAVGVLDVPA